MRNTGTVIDTPQLPVISFARGELSGAECFTAWRDLLSIVFDVDPTHREEDREFDGSMTTYHLGGSLISRTSGSGVRFRRDGATIARSSIDHYLVQIYLDGGYRGVIGRREVEMRSGDVCILDMTQPLATQANDFANITVVIPRESLAPLVKSPDCLHGLILPGTSAAGALLGDHLKSLHRQIPNLTVHEAVEVARGTAGLVAACAGPALDACETTGAELRSALIRRIRRFIEERLASPELDSDLICREFGLSRASLYRLFEPLGGVSNHVRERRLSRALADLVSPQKHRERVTDIAFRWGFGSEASFSRAFRAAYGMSPREAREAAASLHRLANLKHDGTMDRTFRQWMRTLNTL